MLDLSSSDGAEWESALESYTSCIEAYEKPKLTELDSFYRDVLPLEIAKRDPEPYLKAEEVRKVVEWKVTRGKWRPNLMNFAKSLTEEAVQLASRAAFAEISRKEGHNPNLEKAVKEISTLKGIGPATASALLAAYRPDLAPFMSDDAIAAALGACTSKDYTLKKYLEVADKLQKKAKELGKKADGERWTASDIERAIWASNRRDQGKKTSTKKREAEESGEKLRKRGRPSSKPAS